MSVDAPTEAVVVFDLSTLRFAWQDGRRALALLTADGELLGVVACEAGTTERQGAFLVLEQAAATARLHREGRELRVGFYNPYTAEVSLDAGPSNRVFGAARPLTLNAGGNMASVGADSLDIAGHTLPERQDFDAAAALRAVASHQSI